MRDSQSDQRRSLTDAELLAVIDAGWEVEPRQAKPKKKNDKRRKKRGEGTTAC